MHLPQQYKLTQLIRNVLFKKLICGGVTDQINVKGNKYPLHDLCSFFFEKKTPKTIVIGIIVQDDNNSI